MLDLTCFPVKFAELLTVATILGIELSIPRCNGLLSFQLLRCRSFLLRLLLLLSPFSQTTTRRRILRHFQANISLRFLDRVNRVLPFFQSNYQPLAVIYAPKPLTARYLLPVHPHIQWWECLVLYRVAALRDFSSWSQMWWWVCLQKLQFHKWHL